MGEVQQTLNGSNTFTPKWMCIPRVGLRQGPLKHAAFIFIFSFADGILDLNFFRNESDFCVQGNNDGRLLPICSSMLKERNNPFEMACRSSPPMAAVAAQLTCCLPWKHRPPWKRTSAAWPHSCSGCKGRQVHLLTITTDGRIPFPIAFPLTGRGAGGDPVVHITVAEANLAEMEVEMEKAHLFC